MYFSSTESPWTPSATDHRSGSRVSLRPRAFAMASLPYPLLERKGAFQETAHFSRSPPLFSSGGADELLLLAANDRKATTRVASGGTGSNLRRDWRNRCLGGGLLLLLRRRASSIRQLPAGGGRRVIIVPCQFPTTFCFGRRPLLFSNTSASASVSASSMPVENRCPRREILRAPTIPLPRRSNNDE